MNGRRPDMLKPTLLSGLAFGTVAGLPVISLLNCLCCAPAWGAGLGAAFLYSRRSKDAGVPFSAGQGAKAGALAGVFYALAATTIFLLLLAAMGGGDAFVEQMEDVRERVPGSEEALDRLQEFEQRGWLPAVMSVGAFLAHLGAGLVFSTLGGLIGGAVFKVEPPPAPVEPPPYDPR